MDKIKTSKIAAFVNTGKTAAEVWSRIRKQSELKLAYDAETEEDTFVDEEAPTTSVERYKVSIDGEMVAFVGDPLFDYLDNLRQSRATGTAAETDVLLVYLYDAKESAYAAEKNRASIQIKDFGGEGGGGTASISYTITLIGDPTKGVCTVEEGEPKFTAA